MTRVARLLPASALILALFWGGIGASAQAGQSAPKPQQTGAAPSSAPGGAGARSGQPPATHDTPGPRPDYKFWKDEAVKKELGLTDQQIDRIDRIYNQRAIEIDPAILMMNELNDKLQTMTAERKVDIPTYKLQAGRVEALWAEIRASRTVMLYRMSLVLTPEQNKTLQAIKERMDRGRRGGGPRE